MNQDNLFKKINQSIDDIDEHLMTYLFSSPSQLILAKPVLQSLIEKFNSVFPELNQKIEECKLYDRKLLLNERYNKPALDLGNCGRKRRRTKKLDPLNRAHESMSITIEKLKDVISAVPAHPFNVHDLDRAKYSAKSGLDSLNVLLKLVNEQIEEWEKCQNEFNRLIKEFDKVDNTTANQIRKHWEEYANGDKSAQLKSSELIVAAMQNTGQNSQFSPILRELYAAVYSFKY